MKKLLTLALLAGISCYGGSLVDGSFKIKGPKVSSKDRALFDAVSMGNVQDIETALKAGANANASNEEFWTALMLAAMNGNNEAVKVLIKAGANVNTVIWRGKLGNVSLSRIPEAFPISALCLAKLGKHAEVVKTLIEYGANPSDAFFAAIGEELIAGFRF